MEKSAHAENPAPVTGGEARLGNNMNPFVHSRILGRAVHSYGDAATTQSGFFIS